MKSSNHFRIQSRVSLSYPKTCHRCLMQLSPCICAVVCIGVESTMEGTVGSTDKQGKRLNEKK